MDLNMPLTSKELQQLNFLLHEQKAMSLSKLHGYLTGIISAPLLTLPSEWLPLIWDEDPSLKDSSDKMQTTLALIMRLYNTIIKQLDKGDEFLPLLSLNKEPYEQASLNTQALQEWCQGYLTGIMDEETEEEEDDEREVYSLYLLILAVASRSEAVKQELKHIFKDMSQDEIHHMSVEALPAMISDIYQYWREQERGERVFSDLDFPKVGRNDPCPCGSGKKYKKCCWQKMMN